MADRLIFGLLAAIVALSPLPLGSSPPAAWLALTMIVLAALALAGFVQLIDGHDYIALPRMVIWAALLFLGVCSWILVQTRPEAPPEWHHPAWSLTLPSLVVQSAPSLDPMVGREALARLVGYVGMFALAFLVGQRRQRGELLLRIILATITGYAAFGLVGELIGWYGLFGIELSRGRVSGPFAGPNIFAAYVNLGVVTAFCLLLWNRRGDADSPRLLTTFTRLLTDLLEKRSLLVLALSINLLAVVTSASRAGIVSLGLAAILILAVALRGSRWPLFVVAGALASFLTWGMISSGGETLLDRLSTLFSGGELDASGSIRVDAWRLAIAQFRNRPWLGQGYGTFAEAFHLARAEHFVEVVFDYLHSTWLELLIELGWPAMAALTLSLLFLLGTCVGALRRGTASGLPLVGLSASVVLGLHGLVDFAGQIPAVAFTWAGIMGLACGRAAIAGSNQPISTGTI